MNWNDYMAGIGTALLVGFILFGSTAVLENHITQYIMDECATYGKIKHKGAWFTCDFNLVRNDVD